MFLVGKLLSNKQTYKIWLFMCLLQIFLRNVAFLIYALFGEISILEIPVVGNFSLFAGLPQVRTDKVSTSSQFENNLLLEGLKA